MNYFEIVFAAVKEHCGERNMSEDPECFNKISRIAKVSPTRIDYYLDTLDNMGLIKYSQDKGYIQITPYGQLKKNIF